MVANGLSIRDMNFSDSDNFLGSKNVKSLAKERGWWNPNEGPFNQDGLPLDHASAPQPEIESHSMQGLPTMVQTHHFRGDGGAAIEDSTRGHLIKTPPPK